MDRQQVQSALLFAALGFEPASQSTLSRKLENIRPNGGTSLRDATAQGVQIMIQLNAAIHQLQTGGVYKFVHIVITDGQDTSSNISFEELGAAFYAIGASLPKEFIRTVFVGIDLADDQKAQTELTAISLLGGDTSEIHNIQNTKISQILEKVRLELGIRSQRQQLVISQGDQTLCVARESHQPLLKVSEEHYAVLFNLDISGSMTGRKMEQVEILTQNKQLLQEIEKVRQGRKWTFCKVLKAIALVIFCPIWCPLVCCAKVCCQ
ncbi:UNKNOWN [Stylonychia lemnae]|uniref:VWFA domain-containing protein n=1 Tax=Stylonychia lemnae TaxID=5949 RepID=A0A078ACL1_STYLE|nr:UNKNOWN [Stylonychia lemnae]|eukprot:CDW79990.1 UNKNOWN [Stylonychia lemnae]